MPTKTLAFESYLTAKGLRNTRQRQLIAEHFLGLDRHVGAEELHREISKKDPTIGLATVYRTMRLLKDAGLAQERRFGDSFGRFESAQPQRHHDHLICVNCGKIFEFESPRIEQLQKDVARRHHFTVLDHKLELYGLCPRCSKKTR